MNYFRKLCTFRLKLLVIWICSISSSTGATPLPTSDVKEIACSKSGLEGTTLLSKDDLPALTRFALDTNFASCWTNTVFLLSYFGGPAEFQLLLDILATDVRPLLNQGMQPWQGITRSAMAAAYMGVLAHQAGSLVLKEQIRAYLHSVADMSDPPSGRFPIGLISHYVYAPSPSTLGNSIRLAHIRALGYLGDSAAVAKLNEMLNDPSVSVNTKMQVSSSLMDAERVQSFGFPHALWP